MGKNTDGHPVGRRWCPDRRCVVYLLREFLGFLCRGETLFLVCRWSGCWRPCPPRRWPSNLRGICSRLVFHYGVILDSVTIRRVVTVGRVMMARSSSRRWSSVMEVVGCCYSPFCCVPVGRFAFWFSLVFGVLWPWGRARSYRRSTRCLVGEAAGGLVTRGLELRWGRRLQLLVFYLDSSVLRRRRR